MSPNIFLSECSSYVLCLVEQIRNGVGDEGLEVLGKTCTRLRRLRVEHDDAGSVTQRGVVALAQGCGQLQQLVLYVSDITNAALAMVGHGCEHLTDFRIVLEPTAKRIVDLPLDDGIKLLLKGCRSLSKMAVYLRHGGLTDRGMGYIGEYGQNLKWLLLGCTGETDVGLVNLAYKAQRLQRLEMRDCPFGEAGLAAAVVAMSSLKFLWMQGYRAVEAGEQLLALSRPYLNLEISLASAAQPGQLIVYYGTAGPRSDYPADVSVLVPNSDDLLPDDLLPPELYSSGSTNG
jgi:coronatine-insensitive protein 1